VSARNNLLAALAAVSINAAAADNFAIDPNHTYPSLEFPHSGLSIWRGKFNKTTGKVTLDRAARTGSAEILVDTASIDFGHARMNQIALTEDWLNAAKHPTMTYKGSLRFEGNTPVALDGQLTLLGVTKPLKLKINTFKCIDHPYYKKEVCGADAEGELDRADFGMGKYTEDGMGRIHLRIQVEAIREG
jgi:polyisoprenoid-binding protein YceI